jgi:hypothetical protein
MNAIAETTAGVTVTETSARKGAVNGSKTAAHGTLNGGKSNRVQPKDYATKQREKWLNKLSDELRIVFREFPFPRSLPTEICAEWVWWIQQECFRAMYVRLDLKDTNIVTPVELGGFLGYQCAYAVWMMESFAAITEDQRANPEKYKNVVLTPEDCERGRNYFCRLEEWYGALRRLAGRALKSCVYQSYADMSAYLSAYSGAFGRKPKPQSGLGNFGSTAFGVYYFMLWHWRAIERLDSVRELHEMLRKQMGEYRTGDLKRIEKICQRSGLHFRKPGRPRASR